MVWSGLNWFIFWESVISQLHTEVRNQRDCQQIELIVYPTTFFSGKALTSNLFSSSASIGGITVLIAQPSAFASILQAMKGSARNAML